MKPQTIQTPLEIKAKTKQAEALALLEKHPAIQKAAGEFLDVYARAGEKYFALASALRSAKLEKKDATAVLLAAGLSKSRTSEVVKVSTVPEAIWQKYSAQAIGFKAAIEASKGEDSDAEGSESTAESSDVGTKKAKTKIYPYGEKIEKLLAKALAGLVAPATTDGQTVSLAEFGGQIKVGKSVFYVAVTANFAE